MYQISAEPPQYTNCSHPLHPGLAPHSEGVKSLFVFNWSEKSFGVPSWFSLDTLTLKNDPTTCDMFPSDLAIHPGPI
jgi:hypothetical protein